MPTRLSKLLAALALMSFVALAGCKDKKAEAREEDDDSESDSSPSRPSSDDSAPSGKVITEQHGDVTLSWMVEPNGDVWLAAKDKGADVPLDEIEGDLLEESKQFALKNKDDLKFANIGKLGEPLNEVKYDLKVRGKPVKGMLLVPKAGTPQLVAGADHVAKAKLKPDTKGPHGGVVQVIDEHVVEIVGKKGSGDVRVYFLDDDLKPIKPKEQTIRLAAQGDESEVIVLTPDPTAAYLQGTFKVKTNPTRLTVVLEEADDVDCVIVGYEPAEVLIVGPAAPVVVVHVVESWDVVVVEPRVHVHKKWKGKGKGKGRGKHRGRGVHVHVH